MNEWLERKNTLKKEICDYFFSRSKDMKVVEKACLHIKEWGEISAKVFSDGFSKELEAVKPDYECVSEHFSPNHRGKVAEWINRYAQLALEALQYLEAQRTWKKCWARDDFEYEDWEKEQPHGEIQVCCDRIRVLSFEYIEGFVAKLPKKGKKSVGKLSINGGWEWNYPLSELESLKGLHLPIIYSIDAEKPK